MVVDINITVSSNLANDETPQKSRCKSYLLQKNVVATYRVLNVKAYEAISQINMQEINCNI